MRDVILFAYAYPPDSAPGAVRPARFTKYLRRFGHRTHVITASKQDVASSEVHFVADPRPVVLQRLWRLGHDFTCMGWVAPAVRTAAGLIERTQAPVVISTYPPVAAHYAALRCKRQDPGIKWIADFRDPLAGSPIRRRQYGNRLCDPLLERIIFANADAIIANTDSVASMWKDKYPQWSRKISLIWNGYDPEEAISPAPLPPRRQKILAHVGEIYRERHPAPALEALSSLIHRGDIPRDFVKVVCLGSTLEETGDPIYFKRFVAEGIAEFKPRVSRPEALKAIAEADYLCLLDLAPQLEQPMQVPSKLFDYARLGRPILTVTVKHSPLDRILSRAGLCGSTLYWGDDPREHQLALQQFLTGSQRDGRPSQWFESSFNCVHQTEALAQLIQAECGVRTLTHHA